MIPANYKLNEVVNFLVAFPSALPSSSNGTWASMANYERVAVLIYVNNATTVTGSAITFSQATSSAGAGSKSLGFTTMDAVLDTASATLGDQPAAVAVVSNTFTTLTTNSKSALYVVNFKASDLDVANNFYFFRSSMATGVATTMTVIYAFYGPKYAQQVPLPTTLA